MTVPYRPYLEPLAALEALPHPAVDRERCAWTPSTQLQLAEQFIATVSLTELYGKYLDRVAAEELAEEPAEGASDTELEE